MGLPRIMYGQAHLAAAMTKSQDAHPWVGQPLGHAGWVLSDTGITHVFARMRTYTHECIRLHTIAYAYELHIVVY